MKKTLSFVSALWAATFFVSGVAQAATILADNSLGSSTFNGSFDEPGDIVALDNVIPLPGSAIYLGANPAIGTFDGVNALTVENSLAAMTSITIAESLNAGDVITTSIFSNIDSYSGSGDGFVFSVVLLANGSPDSIQLIFGHNKSPLEWTESTSEVVLPWDTPNGVTLRASLNTLPSSVSVGALDGLLITATSPVPEPSSTLLLVLSLGFILRRKR